MYSNSGSSTSTYTSSESGDLTSGKSFTRKASSANAAIKKEKKTQNLSINDM